MTAVEEVAATALAEEAVTHAKQRRAWASPVGELPPIVVSGKRPELCPTHTVPLPAQREMSCLYPLAAIVEGLGNSTYVAPSHHRVKGRGGASTAV